MRPYQLIVSDIDGTLIGADGAISAANLAALRRASAEKGARVAFCTGRVLTSAMRFVDQLGLDGYHILSDGAMVRNPETGHDLYLYPLPLELVREMALYAREHNLFLELFTPSGYLIENESEYLVMRRAFGLSYRKVDFLTLGAETPVIKGGLICDAAATAGVEDFLAHFKGRLSSSYAIAPPFPEVRFFNLVSPGVSKGKALKVLADHLGVALAQVMALGDADNDIAVFKVAGFSVAMGNAPEAVRRAADYVTASVNDDGVARAIEKFVLDA